MVKLGLGLKQVVVAELFLAIFIPFGKATEFTFIALVIALVLMAVKLLVGRW